MGSFISCLNRCVYHGVAEVSIYVRDSYKGKQVGTQLLTHLIAKSEKHGIWTLQSGMMEDNLASIRLHEKCGFRKVGYRERIGKDRFGSGEIPFLWNEEAIYFKGRKQYENENI